MKLWKRVKPEEAITVGELYKRYFGESGSPQRYDNGYRGKIAFFAVKEE